MNPNGHGIFSLPNPIPQTVVDREELQKFFRKYAIVPYYGTVDESSHSFLDLLVTLCQLSPTFGATMRDLQFFTFGLNVDLVGNVVPGLAIDPVELGDAEKLAFSGWLGGLNISMRTIQKVTRTLDYHLQCSGNAWLRIRRVRVGGTTRYYFKAPHFLHTAYLRSIDTGEEFAIISKFLGDDSKMNKYPPTLLRVTQMDEELKWTRTDSGVDEAIIHVKAGKKLEQSDFYNQPDIIDVLPQMYIDYQVPNLNSKIAATELVTKKLLAFQAPDPNSLPGNNLLVDDKDKEIGADGNIGSGRGNQFQQNMLVLKQLVTNLSSHPSQMGAQPAASIAGVEYPYGGNAPVDIDLEMNRDTKHQTFQLEQATARICACLGWSPELIGVRAAKATLGGNLLYDMFTIRNTATIVPRQNFYQSLWNGVIGQICEMENGEDEWKNYGIKFPGVIEEMLAQFGAAGGTLNEDANLQDPDQVEDPDNNIDDE